MRGKVFVVLLGLRGVALVVVGAAATGACAAIADIRQPPGLEEYEPTPFSLLDAPAEKAFQPISCGAAPVSDSFSLKNAGSRPLPYELELRPNATFAIHGAPASLKGSIGAGSSVSVAIDITASLPGTQTAEVLVKVDGKVRAVPLRVEVVGALLSITPSFLDFGEIPVNKPSAPVTVSFRNDGNDNLSVSKFVGGTAFTLDGTTLAVPKNEVRQIQVSMNVGGAGAPVQFDVPLAIDGAVCRSKPTLSLRGQHVDSSILVSPLSLDLGALPCAGDSAGQGVVSISNDSTSDTAQYVATLGPDSHFALGTDASGSVPTKIGATLGVATIHVGAKPGPLPFDEVHEQMSLQVTVGGVSTTRTVRLSIARYGGTLSLPTPQVAPIHLGDTAYVPVKNDGNGRVCVRYTTSVNGFEVPQFAALNPQDESIFGVKFSGPAKTEGTTSNIGFEQVDCGDVAGLLLNGRLCGTPPTLPVQGIP